MKRHEALIPLSHDHHQALLVALRLKKGGPASQRDTWPVAPDAQREMLFTFVEHELLPHFMLEEELLFPPCATSTDPELQTLAADLAQDHSDMRRLLEDIRTAPIADLPENMSALGVMLEAHVRKEERSFFPLVEEGIEQQALTVDIAALAEKHALYRTPPACDV